MVGLEHIWELFLVMLLDYFGVFGCFYAKMDEISKIWAMSGHTPQRRDPHAAA